MRYLLIIAALFCSLPQISAQNNIAYGAGISYTNGAPSFVPPARTSRVAIDTVTGKWYHYNTPGGWQLLGNTIEEIAGCTTPAYTPTKGDSRVVINKRTIQLYSTALTICNLGQAAHLMAQLVVSNGMTRMEHLICY
jgi:hypothetical protein